MNKITIKRSKAAMTVFILLGSSFAIIAIAALYFGEVGGFCMILLAIIGIAFGIIGLRDKSPRIIIDNDELWVRELGTERILLKDVKSARIEWIVRLGNNIVIELKTGEKHSFYASAMEIPASKILSLIQERIPDNTVL